MSDLDPAAEKLRLQLLNPWKLKFFFWKRLPSLLFWRVKLIHLDTERATVSIPFTKKTQNPFRSIYFAAQAGAAEFSTGALAVIATEGRGKISMLVTGMRSEFHKKATEVTLFTCSDGDQVFKAVDKALESGEGQTVTLKSEGRNSDGELISTFWIEWSFKKK
jgi:hypothetical protein